MKKIMMINITNSGDSMDGTHISIKEKTHDLIMQRSKHFFSRPTQITVQHINLI